MDAIAPGPEPNRSSVVTRLMLRRRSARRNWQGRAVEAGGPARPFVAVRSAVEVTLQGLDLGLQRAGHAGPDIGLER